MYNHSIKRIAPPIRDSRNTADRGNMRAVAEEELKWTKPDRPWSEYPIGTRARQSWEGGWWEKTAQGWKWCCGSTFPTPGGANEVMERCKQGQINSVECDINDPTPEYL